MLYQLTADAIGTFTGGLKALLAAAIHCEAVKATLHKHVRCSEKQRFCFSQRGKLCSGIATDDKDHRAIFVFLGPGFIAESGAPRARAVSNVRAGLPSTSFTLSTLGFCAKSALFRILL
jgi:hypothetical protein